MKADFAVERLIQAVKTTLVKLGPDSAITRYALTRHARARGFRMNFEGSICIRKQAREIRLAKSTLHMIPFMVKYFDLYFQAFEAPLQDGAAVLDFSKPGFHRYAKTGREFYFSSIPEEEFGEQYTRFYRPRSGDVVFDLGANAGATACFFGEIVGVNGKVFAFEPDDSNYECLLRNISHCGLRNIVPVKKAVGGFSGPVKFHMDGTLAAGLADLVTYPAAGILRTVDMLSLEDACASVGAVPRFIKMDVEGAETIIVSQARNFLKAHPIEFGADSGHMVGGTMTCGVLDNLFASIGYKVFSSADSGQMFTWASPPQNSNEQWHAMPF